MEHDWDIESGVGITALFVAAGRDLETQRPDRLINDPYASLLVRATSTEVPRPDDEGGEFAALWQSAIDYLGVRSRYFDDFFAQSCAQGVGQAVILASGLDTRAYRIGWPEGFRVFEIDQPKVLEFKDKVLSEQGVQPSCAHGLIPVDLRDEWAERLKADGFDPAVPTAWLAEGLLPYLPPAAERQLVDTVHALSAPGSRFAVENLRSRAVLSNTAALQEAQQRWGVDMEQLFNLEQRPDPADVLAEHGWRVSTENTEDVVERHGRDATEIMPDVPTNENMLMLTAELPR